MKRWGVLAILVVTICVGSDSGSRQSFAQENPFAAAIRTTDPLSPEEELKTFTVPEGFRVQLFAAEPEIQKPMNLAFDAKGRLWVSGSNDYPFPSDNPPHGGDSIRILEDTDHDGQADKVTVFVEDITVPIGLYPYRDGVIAFSIPNIWFYRDTNGDDRCDAREILFGPFDFSRDTHGLNNAFRRGYDGWVYACHGFNNHSKVTGPDGNAVDMQSGNTYRFRPDGSRIEHYTWGQVNPFGMTVDPLGDWYTSDCHTKPVTLLLQGGYYESFGKPHDGLGYVPAVMNHLHGSTAIAGVTQYTGDVFPPEYHRNLFVGNVMTSRVHRDTLKYTGSSVDVVEQPDFVVSSDPWFRPVDIQCGPDGALYIADFYNRIIGHYEVPLDHPGRDRFRARIWRVEYVGDGKTPPKAPNLSEADVDRLVNSMNTQNVPTLMRTIDELSDRHGQEAIPALEQAWRTDLTSPQRVGVLWALHRLDALPDDMLLSACESDSEMVRIHAARVIGERSSSSPAVLERAVAMLRDPSALVRRAAALAVGQHPGVNRAYALILADRAEGVLEGDRHLHHAIKIALKGQLQSPSVFEELQQRELTNRDRRLVASVCLALDSPEASSFLMEAVSSLDLSEADLRSACTVIARNVSVEDVESLQQIVRSRFPDDRNLQFELLTAIAAGLRKQGEFAHGKLRGWANDLATAFLDNVSQPLSWPGLPTKPNMDNPWGLERRHSADGQRDTLFLSSLPGGERAVSSLRSVEFELPETLSLFVCGHLGFPQEAAIEKNFVRVCLAIDGRELGRALAPRNDLAQKVTFHLKAVAGQRGYLEIVDGIDVPAYAWIGISRIEPPVVTIPGENPIERTRRLQSGCHLVANYLLEPLFPRVADVLADSSVDESVRQIAARTLAIHRESPAIQGLGVLAGKPLPAALQAQVESALESVLAATSEDQEKQLKTLVASVTLNLQQEIALEMSLERKGAELMARFLQTGTMSGRVLLNAQVQQRLLASLDQETASKLKQILDALPPVSQERDQTIAALREDYRKGSHSVEAGQKLFETKCAACHQLAGKGKVIGPQLDGIGNRGLQRLLEDIIDPNRNVDVAFRSRVYALEDGRVLTGVFRREEGQSVIIADNKGEEIAFPKSAIEEQKSSTVSIMPDNWGTSLTPEELCGVVAFLLEQRQRVENN